MSFLGKLFGSEKIIDSGIAAVDKIVFTDEEKADAKIKILQAYEPFKIAQRFLALTFCPAYAVAWLATFLASFFMDVTDQMEYLTSPDGLRDIVLVICAFYFGGGLLEGAIARFRQKK